MALNFQLFKKNMDTKIIIIAIVVVAVIFSIFQSRKRNQKKSDMMQQLVAIEGFIPSQQWMGKDAKSGIAIDENTQTIGLVRDNDGSLVTGTFSYQDILASEVLEDNQVVLKTSRKNRAGRIKLNELGLGSMDTKGGIGTWEPLSSEIIRSVTLRITVNSATQPFHEVSFMILEGKKQAHAYSIAMKNAKHWHALLEALMRQADEDGSGDSH